MERNKIITKEEFAGIRDKFRHKKTVVLCHGVFDLLHYGHIEHLKEAKAQGDILVVSVTAAKYVNKGPGRPYFNDRQRMMFLANLECVDYVLLSESVTVHDIVEFVQPDVYVKGQEYAVAENDVTGNITSEKKIVERYGGRIYFTQGEVYSSTWILNNFFGAISSEIVTESRRLKDKYGRDIAKKMQREICSFQDKSVLVVGDIIIDDYIFCAVQGLTMKDATMSTRYESKERYAGGALAVARHLANFSKKVTLLSQMGEEEDIAKFIMDTMHNVEFRIVQERNFITPVKRRYLKRHPLRQEYDKLFSVNYLLLPEDTRKIDYGNFQRNLMEMLPDYDIVVVCDYGHGLLREDEIRMIEEHSKFLAVNCQANSSNFGRNVITKYRRADSFVVDERELRLVAGQSSERKNVLLRKLSETLNSKYAWLTLGAEGALGIHGNDEVSFPAMTLRVKDTVGAGDAFYSLASLAAGTEMPLDQATLLGNMAGAIKANLVGNSQPLEKTGLLKYLGTILNV